MHNYILNARTSTFISQKSSTKHHLDSVKLSKQNKPKKIYFDR